MAMLLWVICMLSVLLQIPLLVVLYAKSTGDPRTIPSHPLLSSETTDFSGPVPHDVIASLWLSLVAAAYLFLHTLAFRQPDFALINPVSSSIPFILNTVAAILYTARRPSPDQLATAGYAQYYSHPQTTVNNLLGIFWLLMVIVMLYFVVEVHLAVLEMRAIPEEREREENNYRPYGTSQDNVLGQAEGYVHVLSVENTKLTISAFDSYSEVTRTDLPVIISRMTRDVL
ncbi:hypothetical protein EIP91_001350 [Steccherinum ochraceum]|uniref:Uncharacterized protein n=1 Tax=Steccherinum ochraceum TaxID=92696 RepID=A0A4R0RE68_9APHY|nr:hypothetical protein EIP91_001350 [Steccherinum ochraceum]